MNKIYPLSPFYKKFQDQLGNSTNYLRNIITIPFYLF